MWRGSAFGGVKGRTELPGIVEGQNLPYSTLMLRAGLSDTFLVDYLQGKVKVDEYVTHGYKLAEINNGFEAMHVNSCLLVSVSSCLTIFSRAAIAFVLSSTCHEFQRKGSEKNLVVLCIEYECSHCGMQHRCSETIQFLPSRLVESIIPTGRVF